MPSQPSRRYLSALVGLAAASTSSGTTSSGGAGTRVLMGFSDRLLHARTTSTAGVGQVRPRSSTSVSALLSASASTATPRSFRCRHKSLPPSYVNVPHACRSGPRCLLLASRSTSSASSSDDDADNDDSRNDAAPAKPSIRIQPKHRRLLDQVITNLTHNVYQNIVVVNGAGVSTSCGIPDFRTPGTGLYSKLEEYNLPYPEAIFELDYFKREPQAFATLAKEIWPGQEEGPRPSRTHAFLKVLEDKGMLRRVYTQNIDGLESLAGMSDDKLVECHGHFRSFSCISCQFTSDDVAECRDSYLAGVPHQCPQCGSLSKRDIVFFGEELPRRFQELVEDDMDKCDLLIVQGTSLLVNPVAAMPSWVGRNVPRLLLNRELVGGFVRDELMRTMNGHEEGDDTCSGRDMFLEGDCDHGVEEICRLIGADWVEDLLKAHADCSKSRENSL